MFGSISVLNVGVFVTCVFINVFAFAMMYKFFASIPDNLEPSEIENLRAMVEKLGGLWTERQPDDEEEEEDEDGLLDDILGSMYAAEGDTEALMVKSSSEVAYEISDMAGTSVAAVAKWLKKHGFCTKVVDDTVCWILYDKNVSY